MLNDELARPDRGSIIPDDISIQGADAPLPDWLLAILEPEDSRVLLTKQEEPAGVNTARVCDLVANVLLEFHAPYSPDIIDKVCSAIEANIDWLSEYFKLVTIFSGHDQYSQTVVNDMISWFVILLTGMVESGKQLPAQSRLLTSYTELRGL